MWSYPNSVPPPARRMGQRLDALDFDAIHSAFWERGDIERDGKAAVQRSIVRHIHGPRSGTISNLQFRSALPNNYLPADEPAVNLSLGRRRRAF
jgi:hypothetical protein